MVMTVLSLILTCVAPAPAALLVHDDVLVRIERAAREGVGRGVVVSRTVFDKNVHGMAGMQRDLAEGGVAALLRFSPPGAPFPYLMVTPGVLPGLIAQQTRTFSLWADRAAELRLDLPRTADWRYTTVGRMIRKMIDDVRDELLVVGERESARTDYLHDEFAGLTMFARELASVQNDPEVADALLAVSDMSPPVQAGRAPGPREYRVALIQMLARLRNLSDHLDLKFCARALTH